MLLFTHPSDDSYRNTLVEVIKISRLTVGDNQVSWSLPWADYNPPEYNSEVLNGKPWADPEIGGNFQPKWNALDGRTGLKGRGVLGRWGPNHAADPIVTRWRRINGQTQFNDMSKLPILEVCVIQRRDCNEWALPGGMVDPGERISVTLKREFMEEALNSLERESDTDEVMVTRFFEAGTEIYKGYVDDPRNTDNAWMETVAVNFHDEIGRAVGKFALEAGDDAKSVKWMGINKDLALYASHSKFIEKVVIVHQAHW
ncbi:uncharacterized protein CBL_09725 [Carabus blaptoides fortunei]